MDEFHKHVFRRLDNLESELGELRCATWPVCQGIVDQRTGPYATLKDKRRFFRFLSLEEIQKLVGFKGAFMRTSPDAICEELQQILVAAPQSDAE